MSELKPCPLCNSENIQLMQPFFDGYSPDCLCMKCGCKADKKAWNTRTQSECDLEYLCKSYAEYSHLCAVMRVMPNYQDWLIEQGLSTELAPNVGQWISVDEAEPEEGHLYWHTHIRPDGSFIEVLVGAYVKAFKKMDSGNFTHYMKCVKPLPPKEQGQ